MSTLSTLRRRAEKLGWAIHKSRTRNIHANDHGEYMLIDQNRGTLVTGANYDADLEMVESFIAREEARQ
ncbi:hypothetical protein F9K90_07130 [Brucella anthropi]|uniref:hypothetical protein n=1 Tax=Brucella anthropi TaxID=529 RepID=UPI00124F3013|nr:hypothetical protein [Brucella anthropi]KAB2738450.1 hypothetical protein F9K90_07130 [Brucella anthropi]